MAYEGGNLKSTSINGVKLYTVASQQRSLATWINPKKLRALRKDKDYTSRVDLIQDLRFDIASSKIKATPDGEFLIASGIYPPQVKVYELRELSLKFKRHFDSEIIDFQILDDDYSKLAFMCADRSIVLHAKYGKHHTLRIPRMGRNIEYDNWSADLLCAASSPDVYRISLQRGQFLPPLNTESPAINVVSRSKLHGIVACGGVDGAVECFDTRTKLSSIGRIDAIAPAGDKDQEVTALAFDDIGGFQMAVGSSSGKILIYDLRSSDPIRIKDHMYDSPILNIKWHSTLNSEKPKMITTDKHIVRIWDPDTGEGMTSIEPTLGPINDTCVFKDSGLMLLALNSSQIPSYFLPALGPAPKWCSYLENLTEELEEGAETTIYDDFKFLTKEELERLNLTNLIGTNLLRAYLHGFFIDYRLYKKAKSLADPFAYDAYIEQRKKEKLDEERANRITVKRKLPKVNRRLANQILEEEEAETEKKDEEDVNKAKKASKKKKGLSSEIFQDERFANMFKNENFEINELSPEYLALHPVASTKQPSLVEEHFEPVLEDSEQSLSNSDASVESEFEDEPSRDKHKKARAPKLYEVKDEKHAEAFWNSVSLAKEERLTMEERIAAMGDNKLDSGILNEVKLGPGGSREISFKPRSSAKYMEDDDDESPRKKNRSAEFSGPKANKSGSRSGMRHGSSRGGNNRGRGRGRGRRGRR
ncbi:nucleolar protein 10 isoform X2 [Cucurbita maxima]|uniref:Nucleolar protein 10 isoform X1 n=1 Tax=Cucurbita maxima TaxID=3661 RepID=A0A6J1I2M0_CUCMA|nr:nucleolar protein 10 isoform X1 [Cucurbita maxima]XP_022971182.1 nucleolar protein 10 isoform X2 [Cucurbita maxima]